MMTNESPEPNTSARATRSPRRGRLLVIVSVGLLLMGSGVAAIAAIHTGSDNDVVLDVADLITSAPPETVPPVVSLPSTSLPSTSPGVTPTTAVVTDVDTLSPLASRLGRRISVIPEIVEPRPRPVGLEISSVDTSDIPIRDVGLDESGEFEVPDETEIGWYRYGATAGQPGATVLAAHVSWNGTTGPFFRLGTVEPGDQVTVTLDNGTERQYEVTERTMYGKSELPRERIWRNTGDETLVLITCGGDFNPNVRRYLQNIVVYAVPTG